MTSIEPVLQQLMGLPGVATAVQEAREACTQLRWHPALRRRGEEVRAEAVIRAARAGAVLEGARYPVDLFRDVARGAAVFPDDASGRLALASLRLLSEARSWESRLAASPSQALARFHVVAGHGHLPAETLGRPRQGVELPGDGIGEPADAPVGPQLRARLDGVLALLLAGLVQAEVLTARPFSAGNGLLGRALARTVMIGRGLDPVGAVVWEAALVEAGPGYARGLLRYGTGEPTAVGAYLISTAEAVVAGAGHGRAICDDVLAGSLSRTRPG